MKKKAPNQANSQDGHNICQKHTAHKKTACFYSGIDDQGEPKSQDRNGYRRTHDINKSVIEGLEKYRVFKNIDVVVQPNEFRLCYDVIPGETQINSPEHRSILEDHKEENRRQDEQDSPKLNPRLIAQLPPGYGDLGSPYPKHSFSPISGS